MYNQQVMQQLSQYLDQLLEQSDAQHPAWNMEKIRQGTPNKWNYIDGCMMTAVLAMYRMTGEKRYLDFVQRFMDGFVQPDGSIQTYSVEEFNLDNVNPGKTLIALYQSTGQERYRKAMELVRSQLEQQPRTKAGSFWHKKIYPHQVWLDGLYMAQPFYMQYETLYNGKQGCLDSFKQFQTVHDRMRQPETGLYYHGYDESRSMDWADPCIGCSPNIWLRSLGWYLVGLVDTLEAMDEQMYYEYRWMKDELLQLVKAMLPYQQPDGMFYQLPALPQQPGNYLETSGTALFAYGVLKGVRLGYLPSETAQAAEKAFFGTTDRYLSIQPDGSIQLGGICLVAGLGGPTRRNGSVEYYLSEPVVENEAKGVAPLILAFTELLERERNE